MLTCGQGAKMRSHVSQVATCGESGPFLCRRVLQAVVPVVRVVQTAYRLAILFDQSGGIELGVSGEAWPSKAWMICTGVLLFRCSDATPARSRAATTRAGSHRSVWIMQYREFTNSAANRFNAGSARMPDALEQVRPRWPGRFSTRFQ